MDSPEIDKALYLRRYPELSRLAENANHNYILRSRTIQTPEFIRRPTTRAETYDNPGPNQGDPFSNSPGFYPIPYEEIGLYRDTYRLTFR